MIAFSVYEGTKKGMEPEPYQEEHDPRLRTNESLESYLNNFTEEEILERLSNAGLKIVKIQKELDSSPGEYPKPKILVLAQKE